MNNRTPLVSVIVPTYNRGHLLPESLKSLVKQTYKNWECIVIDDGSTDDTEVILEKYRIRDPRFYYYKRPEGKIKGASSCRNIGFEHSKGDYIQFLDSDDLLDARKIEHQIMSLAAAPEKTLACCNWNLFSINPPASSGIGQIAFDEANYSPCKFFFHLGQSNTFFPPHSYLTPRELIEQAGPWNETITNNDDAEFFARVFLKTSGIIYNTEPYAFYRKSGEDSLSRFDNKGKVQSLIKSWSMIESYLVRKCDPESLIYVENSKGRVFQTLKNRFPYLLYKNRLLFKKQFAKETFRLNKIYIFRKEIYSFLKGLKRNIFKK